MGRGGLAGRLGQFVQVGAGGLQGRGLLVEPGLDGRRRGGEQAAAGEALLESGLRLVGGAGLGVVLEAIDVLSGALGAGLALFFLLALLLALLLAQAHVARGRGGTRVGVGVVGLLGGGGEAGARAGASQHFVAHGIITRGVVAAGARHDEWKSH